MTRTRKPPAAACGLVALLVILPTAGLEAREKWGPFRGQIVDVETDQPISGAVVLAVWHEAVFALVQTNQKFYDAREAVTGPDGRFEIPRLRSPLLGFRIFEPMISYFAPGYIVEAEVVTPQDAQPFVAPTVIQMRRAKNREEQLDVLARSVPHLPWDLRSEKMPKYLEALNEARRRVGLSPYPVR